MSSMLGVLMAGATANMQLCGILNQETSKKVIHSPSPWMKRSMSLFLALVPKNVFSMVSLRWPTSNAHTKLTTMVESPALYLTPPMNKFLKLPKFACLERGHVLERGDVVRKWLPSSTFGTSLFLLCCRYINFEIIG